MPEVRPPTVRTALTPHFTTVAATAGPSAPPCGPAASTSPSFPGTPTRVHLVLFKEGHEEPLAEIPLDPTLNKTGDVWHVFVHGLPADLLYGYRVYGPFAPKPGHRFNPTPILLDPYAPALSGGHRWGVPDVPHGQSTAAAAPRPARRRRFRLGRRRAAGHAAGADRASTSCTSAATRATRPPACSIPAPSSACARRSPTCKSLGVTAVQLMPVLEFDELDQPHKHPATGEPLKNYWGYSPLSFFAPKAVLRRAAPASRCASSRRWSRRFHRAGIEVILDVVYNHTCEGNEHGPTLSFRGLDNAIYYMLDREGRYYNFSGCGNTLNCNHPRGPRPDHRQPDVPGGRAARRRLPLRPGRRSWAAAPNGKVLEDPPLIQHIAEHPVLAGTKLIAEAWDAAGLSQLGKFPAWGRWAELNGQFRDDVRRFVRSEPGMAAALAKRICGSLDLYGDSSRHPHHSVNFVTCHDGFTLNDLVSYNHKHNGANGENNRDGWDDNFSYNCGHEGPTDDPHVNALRQRQMRNFLTLLLISQGVPLLLAGRRVRPHAAGQQQRLLPGQRDFLGRLDAGREERRAAALHADDDRPAEEAISP